MKKTFFSLLFLMSYTVMSIAQVTNFTVGQVAPDFTVTDVHGKIHKLSDYTSQGKNVLIDFFFVTCGPCQAAAPKVNDFYHKYGCNQGNIVVLGIDNGDNNAQVIQFENTFTGENPYPSCSGIEGGGNPVCYSYGVEAYPTFCLIGTDGKFKNTDIWPISVELLEAACNAAGITLTPMACNTPLVCDPITNLIVTDNENKINLSWTKPANNTNLTKYNVLRNDVKIGETTTNNYTDLQAPNGELNYCITAEYTDGCVSEKTCKQITHEYCPPVQSLSYSMNDKKVILTWTAPNAKERRISATLYDQADIITHTGAGANGADVCAMNPGITSAGEYINNADAEQGCILADDFTLESSANIEEAHFYGYQTNSGIQSTITGIYVQIYDKNPSLGGQPIWGNRTDNVIKSTKFSNIYRVYQQMNETARPIMEVVAKINTTLPAGTYWIAYSLTGSTDSGPWGIPVTILNQNETGDGYVYSPITGWGEWHDAGANTPRQGMPFKISGNFIENNYNYNVYRNETLLANTTNTTYTDQELPAGNYNYCVEVVHASCTSAKVCNEVIITGVIELENAGISIFPNPTKNVINIVGDNIKRINVYNIQGKIIYTHTYTNQIDLSAFNDGLYLIEMITTNGKAYKSKIVIKK